MDKFEKAKTLEAAEFYANKQPPADWGVKLKKHQCAVKFIDGSVEVYEMSEEFMKMNFKLRPVKDDA